LFGDRLDTFTLAAETGNAIRSCQLSAYITDDVASRAEVRLPATASGGQCKDGAKHGDRACQLLQAVDTGFQR
jgi:hypothetical protein